MLGKMLYSHLPCATHLHNPTVPQRLNPTAAGMFRDSIHTGQEL